MQRDSFCYWSHIVPKLSPSSIDLVQSIISLQTLKNILLLKFLMLMLTIKNSCLYTLQYVKYVTQPCLTHYCPVFSFYNPWKYQKTVGFLMFSRGIKSEHWTVMGSKIRRASRTFSSVASLQSINYLMYQCFKNFAVFLRTAIFEDQLRMTASVKNKIHQRVTRFHIKKKKKKLFHRFCWNFQRMNIAKHVLVATFVIFNSFFHFLKTTSMNVYTL